MLGDLGFRVLGDLGFTCLGFRIWGSGFKARVWGLV